MDTEHYKLKIPRVFLLSGPALSLELKFNPREQTIESILTDHHGMVHRHCSGPIAYFHVRDGNPATGASKLKRPYRDVSPTYCLYLAYAHEVRIGKDIDIYSIVEKEFLDFLGKIGKRVLNYGESWDMGYEPLDLLGVKDKSNSGEFSKKMVDGESV
jgi:hypothetical protein